MTSQQLIIESYQKTNHFGREMGMDFEIIEPGKITIQMLIKQLHLATINVAHGGVIAGMMDAALGVATLSLSSVKGKIVSTVDLHMNFLQPVKLNDVLKATGEVIKAGNRIYFAEATIINQHGEIISKGNGTFNAYPVEKIME
jgi:uncharacterized protein (TIGR00369 family)